jgi:hypothetical protein
MSKAKTAVLAIGLIAVVAVAFVGASSYVADKSSDSGSSAAGCGGHSQAMAADSQTKSGCSGPASASKSCPTAKVSAADHKGCAAAASCPMSKAGCSKTCGSKSAKTAKIESIEQREGKTVVLTGRYVCGTCELGLEGRSGECQPAFKTKDGKNYLLSSNNLSQRLRAEARDKDVEISSRVRKLDGVKYLEVEVIRGAS